VGGGFAQEVEVLDYAALEGEDADGDGGGFGHGVFVVFVFFNVLGGFEVSEELVGDGGCKALSGASRTQVD
jgi:hypothetical protein